MTNENTIYTTGNISSIAMWIANIICPLLAGYGIIIDQNLIIPLIAAIINIIIGVWSSRNPNTFAFLGNQPNTKNTCECNNETDLNPEYYTKLDDGEDGA